jgi:hypothetical protein
MVELRRSEADNAKLRGVVERLRTDLEDAIESLGLVLDGTGYVKRVKRYEKTLAETADALGGGK